MVLMTRLRADSSTKGHIDEVVDITYLGSMVTGDTELGKLNKFT